MSQGVGRMFCLPKTAWPPTCPILIENTIFTTCCENVSIFLTSSYDLNHGEVNVVGDTTSAAFNIYLKPQLFPTSGSVKYTFIKWNSGTNLMRLVPNGLTTEQQNGFTGWDLSGNREKVELLFSNNKIYKVN